jgi:hypothetical protein
MTRRFEWAILATLEKALKILSGFPIAKLGIITEGARRHPPAFSVISYFYTFQKWDKRRS